jgi:transcriptional regulator with XRE-family HTH domain
MNRVVLEKWLSENGVTLKELARKLGVNECSLWRYRTSKAVKYKTLLAISAVTGLPVTELIKSPQESARL